MMPALDLPGWARIWIVIESALVVSHPGASAMDSAEI